jgi:hypothetical protein
MGQQCNVFCHTYRDERVEDQVRQLALSNLPLGTGMLPVC